MDNANKTSFTMPIKDLTREDYGYDHLKYLKDLGATFNESHYERYNKHFVVVNLPEGFSIGDSFVSGNFKYRIISDENGNNRGTFLIKVDNMNIANLFLASRFKIMNILDVTVDIRFNRVCFGNDDVILFEEGVVNTSSRNNSEMYIQSRLADLRKKCEEHAALLYPDWKNPNAYWDEEPTLTDAQMLARIKED